MLRIRILTDEEIKENLKPQSFEQKDFQACEFVRESEHDSIDNVKCDAN
jgi:hypothetical protein